MKAIRFIKTFREDWGSSRRYEWGQTGFLACV